MSASNGRDPIAPPDLPRVDATTVAEHVRLQSCERFLWYRLHRTETEELLARYGLAIEPLSPLLRARGAAHERAVLDAFRLAGQHEIVDLTGKGVEATRAALVEAGDRPRLLYQARIEGRIGGFPALGITDLLEVARDAQWRHRIRLMDMKASLKDKPEHRIQVAFYAILLRQILEEAGLAEGEMEGVILRPGAEASAFDLAPYEEAVKLLADPPLGILPRMAKAAREDAAYHLTYRCDGCPMNLLCMREAAESRSLGLVPFLTLPEKRALQREDVTTAERLAELKTFDPDGTRLVVADEMAGVVSRLAAQWPVGPNLDLHVQRARAVAHARDPKVSALPCLLEAPTGSLPDRQLHPDLTQVFLDAQHDPLTDRLYMVAALAVGPEGKEREVVEMAGKPPAPGLEDDEEGALLERFVVKLLPAIHDAAGRDSCTLHFYVYDGYDQRVLLEGLRRHLARLAAIPALFDLLTETEALTQSMVSFLLTEVRERYNLGTLSHALPVVARRLGYVWQQDGVAYDRLFHDDVFDAPKPLPDGTLYEGAARFGSQIPIDYAYGAWGIEGAAREHGPLAEDLRGLARMRVHALRYLEDRFSKNRHVEKKAVSVARLTEAEVAGARRKPQLAELCVQFLVLEHHAKLHEKLQLFAMPLDRRVASGASLLVEAQDGALAGRALVRFQIEFERLGLDAELGLATMNVRESDWMVLSEPDTTRPWDIARGRIAIVKAIEGRTLTAELTNLTFRDGRLRYEHRRDLEVVKRGRYALDPIVDDLVGERLLDACRHPAGNVLLQHIEAGSASLAPRAGSPDSKDAIADLLSLLARRGHAPLTSRQQEVVADRLGDRVLLVQGPPGTGKTHTVAWAILARLWAAATAKKRMKVLVTAMTHTAVDVMLRTIAALRADLSSVHGESGRPDPLAPLRLYKEVTDGDAKAEPGIAILGRRGAGVALNTPLLVVGSVPGGIHRILKDAGEGGINWDRKLWDLVVIDEASQFSLPAAILAGAALRTEGQTLIVGDHRQMAPILAHDWEREQRRGMKEDRVYASTFEFLKERGFPSIALDRSFRLHRALTSFLDRHVYAEDRVGLHSHRDERLPRPAEAGEPHPLAAAALSEADPVVIIQHDECASLKLNLVELHILDPILAELRSRYGLDGRVGIGVVVPFRAQKAALCAAHPDLARAGAIDTVERFQGGERDVIVVSATASDPDYVLAESSFLLNPNRFNVAISRPRKKLVVIASSTLFHLIPPDLDLFTAALLWKRLRHEFCGRLLWEGTVRGARVRVMGAASGA